MLISCHHCHLTSMDSPSSSLSFHPSSHRGCPPSFRPLWWQLSLPLCCSQLNPANSDRCVKSTLHLCHSWQVRSGRAGAQQTTELAQTTKALFNRGKCICVSSCMCACECVFVCTSICASPFFHVCNVPDVAWCQTCPESPRSAIVVQQTMPHTILCAFITTCQTFRETLQDYWKTPCQPRAANPLSTLSFLISTHWIIYSWNQNPDNMQKKK